MGYDDDSGDDAGSAVDFGDDAGDGGGGYSQADADAEMAELREDAMRDDIAHEPVSPDDPRTGEEIAADLQGQIEDRMRAWDTVIDGGGSLAEATLGAGMAPGEVLDALDRAA